ncbi:MAG: 3-deoxy-D-manno-octulosonic acid transferase [Bacteroidia bacterium]|nr:3-deoxy-D-manno-octulosonic acid transferase [Bacteroidia bacterium]
MIVIYNIFIRVITLIFWTGRFFNKKIALGYNGRKNWREKLKDFKNNNTNKTIWFHCASLGEFEMARPVIDELNSNHKNKISILITFFSPSGYEIRKNFDGANAVFYLPLDTISNAEDFVEILKPDLAIFVKYEFWINYIECLKRKKIKILLINAIFNDNHIYFKWYGKIFLNTIKMFDYIFVQNRYSLKKLKEYNIKNIGVSGDLRYDRVIANSKSGKNYPEIEKFCNGSFVIIGGSTWQTEEDILKNCLIEFTDNVKLIIAPHDVSKKHINIIEEQFKDFETTKFSESVINENAKVLIIDCIGHLSSIYKYGNSALVGGGFSGALHNIIEPAVYGIPIYFGYKFTKFPEAAYFKKNKIGFSFNNSFSFNREIREITNNAHLRNEIKTRSASVFKANTGSTMQVYYKIKLFCEL